MVKACVVACGLELWAFSSYMYNLLNIDVKKQLTIFKYLEKQSLYCVIWLSYFLYSR